MIVNAELAHELAERVEAQPKQCWRNSLLALIVATAGYAPPKEQAVYVEGWLVICNGQIPIEHGWLEVNGEIVDVTLPGEHKASDYHAVFRYNWDEAWKLNKRAKRLPLYLLDRKNINAMMDYLINNLYEVLADEGERDD